MNKVLIAPDAHAKLTAYIRGVTGEISGLGVVSLLDETPYISEVLLFEQEVSGASTDLCPEDLSKFLVEWVTAGRDPSELKLWWHSHANMGVFWSGTDTNTQKTCFKGSDWLVSIVGNRKGEFLCQVNIFKPFHFVLEKLPLVIHYPQIEADVTEEIRAKVKEKSYKYQKGGVGYTYRNPSENWSSQQGWRGWNETSTPGKYEYYDGYLPGLKDAPTKQELEAVERKDDDLVLKALRKYAKRKAKKYGRVLATGEVVDANGKVLT